MALADAVTHPVVAHVDSFGAFLLGFVIDELCGDFVVDFAYCGWLRVAEVFPRIGTPMRPFV